MKIKIEFDDDFGKRDAPDGHLEIRGLAPDDSDAMDRVKRALPGLLGHACYLERVGEGSRLAGKHYKIKPYLPTEAPEILR